MTPPFPPLNINLTTASRSGDISAPNTVNFGSFGAPTVGGLSMVHVLLAAAGVFLVLKLRQ